MEPLGASDPRQVGAYRLLGRLGSGGMGQVFLGESPGGRKVAVKLVLPQHAADADFRRRFAREVAAARQVGGFHTAPVVDADPDADPPWMVTAYVPGLSLEAAVRQGAPLEAEAVRQLGAALAEGLAAVHACGLVHRDLKPSNIILAEDGPRIIDFGIARPIDATALTSPGTVIGTFSFMSPEQVRSERVDGRSDVFALGGVLAYAATGHGPFDAATIPAIVHRIVSEPPVLSGISGPLREIISACLAKDPAGRPALNDLIAFLAGAPRLAADATPRPPAAELAPKPSPSPSPRPRTVPASLPGPVAPARSESPPVPVAPPAPVPVSAARAVPLRVPVARPAPARVPPNPVNNGAGATAGQSQLAVVSWFLGNVERAQNAVLYPGSSSPSSARKRTTKQLRRMRPEGYYELTSRPIPGSPEFIDHLVIGPTGVYAIDSEAWDPKLPIRTWNGKKLYHGPKSQKDRIEHSAWKAGRASEILSATLGSVITVQPALAVYGPKIPWDITTIRNVDVFTGTSLVKYLKRRGRKRDGVTRLTREEALRIDEAAFRLLPDS